MQSLLMKTIRGYAQDRTSLLTEDRMMKKTELNQATLLTLSQYGGVDGKAHRPKRRWLATGLGALFLGLGFAGTATAADVYLQAQSYTKTITLPDATTVDVPMWGFASCTDGTYNSCTLDANAAGPQINADIATDPALTIHLKNTLPVSVSIVIPGQFGGGDPTWTTDANGRRRMQSMTHETAAGSEGTYTWSSLKPGSYLYQSGTHPSIQVPMGLYGALVVNAGSNQPYPNPTSPSTVDYHFDTDAVMLLSEVDPVQNARVVASGLTAPTEQCVPIADYKAKGTIGYPCTIDYNPIYFLVNGQTAPSTPPQITDGTAAQTVLMRFLNAGLRSHTPGFAGLELSLIAEDGNPYPGLPRKQASALLTAGKTMDALVTAPAGNVTWSLFDHMPSFNNEAGINGSALASFNVGTGTPPATASIYAAADTYTDVIEDTPYSAASVLGNDVGLTSPTAELKSQASNGKVVMNADGTFTYTPNKDFSGTDTFMYSAIDSVDAKKYSAVVTLNVSFVNDNPIASADAYSNAVSTTITVDPEHGVLGNDSDPDGDTLTAVIDGVPPGGLTLNADGSFTYSGGVSTTFSYRASDSTLTSDPVTVTLTVTPPSGANLTVKEPGANGQVLTSYRWIVQEDTTYHLDPNNPEATPVLEQQALNMHKSTMPVIAQGCSNCSDGGSVYATAFNQLALDPAKYYYVSVLPNDAVAFDPNNPDARLAGHTIGGAQILPGQTEVTVIVNKQEIPTAQISVEVFEDTWPTNGAIDGNEGGLGGFTITLEDAGGRYGISGGTMLQDAYGNPLKNSLDCFGSYIPPTGVIETCPDTEANRTAGIVGHVLVKNLPPGKYGVIAVPPASQKSWVQTSTIEGTKVIDTWVKANEPAYFNEFGLAGPHAFIGFTRPETTCISADQASSCQVKLGTMPATTYSIEGQVTALHDPRPPLPMLSVDTGSFDILGASRAWVGLNSDAGIGPSIVTMETDPDGHFIIPNVPPGDYQIVVWDIYLDAIISYYSVTVTDQNVVLANNVGIPEWFTRSEHIVFLDDGCGGKPGDAGYADGIRQDCEVGLPEQAVNIRWRDGTVNQSFPTDSEGFVPFDEAFPFFSWQIYEVDYTRFKPTGVTVTVDAGGTSAYANTIQNPQIQNPALFTGANEKCSDYVAPNGTVVPCGKRTETGSTVLLEGFQSMPGQTLTFNWGKVPYQPGENGGIAGIVFYSSTRGEGDPRLTVGDPWEPGIANVKVRLYRVVQRADGSESLSLVKEVETDSWDANVPAGCQGEVRADPAEDALAKPFYEQTLGMNNIGRCYDGFRMFNQARPAVFDGGYAFNDIPPGKYVVEAVLPPGYEQYKEEDMNVGFGDAYTGTTSGVATTNITLPNGSLVMTLPDQYMVGAATGPQPGLAQPRCVGQLHTVPAELSLFPGVEAPFAGSDRPLCNRKEVVLSDQGQAAADFHFFTSTPVAAQFTGLITDDISMETNLTSPSYGEKWSPAYMPFTMRDFKGTEVYRGLADAFGRYNGLIPSTFTANIPIPSGYSPSMMQACLNEAGPTKNPRYFSACNTGQFMPGTNTYLDTPILPQAAFAGGYNPPDCAAPQGTPVIAEVNSRPYRGTGSASFGPLVAPGAIIQIASQGSAVTVPNPDYEGPLAAAPHNAPTITRDFSFGPGGQPGKVLLIDANGTHELAIQSWGSDSIRAIAPATETTGQLVVVRGDNGNSTTNAVTVTVSNSEIPIRVPADQPTIQAAVDAATPGQLILVAAGTYQERVIMWKPVRLQGVGSLTVIDAIMTGSTDLDNWRAVLATHVPDPTITQDPELLVDLLPGLTTISEEGAGITVVGRATRCYSNNANRTHYCYRDNPSRIDGFTITNAANGGAILVHANAHGLEIANNTITANSGQFNGGIRIGQPLLPNVEQSANANGVIVFNRDVNIHHNAVTLNGALNVESAGGGVSINSGSFSYTVANNFICGNYTAGDGAGIGHLGVSHRGTIKSNRILFNQAYNVGFTTSGGGILIAGEPGNGGLTLGTGRVDIDSNLIQGNNAGSGHGGGIRLQYVNGAELSLHNPWPVHITNNMVVNNVAAWSGGGISLLDAVNTFIGNNTVASNDTTATEGSLVVGNNTSSPQPAGIVAQMNSVGLHDAVVTLGNAAFNADFSNPRWLRNNIIWHNRAFHLGILASGTAVGLLPELTQTTVGGCDVANANYWDLGVLGQPQANPTLKLEPRRSTLTSTAGYTGLGNNQGNPDFLANYCNGARSLSAPGPIQVFLGTGEGGNFVDVRFGPLVTKASETSTTVWNYHIGSTSAGLDIGIPVTNGNVPDYDIDGNPRPQGAGVDLGADEYLP